MLRVLRKGGARSSGSSRLTGGNGENGPDTADDCDRYNAAGEYDPNEPAFTEEELTAALDWRQRYGYPTRERNDRCPHPRPCASLAECVVSIAWYFRHRQAIHRRLAEDPEAFG